MSLTDWVGTIGVSILLVAFFLNLMNKIETNGFWYIFLNMLGAAVALVASLLLEYMPFVILEAVWTMVSTYSLVKLYVDKK